MGVGLQVVDRGARVRNYAEWFHWARLNLGADPAVGHAAAGAAIAAGDNGHDQVAAALATMSVLPPPVSADPELTSYAEWFDILARHWGGVDETAHRMTETALAGLRAGQSSDQAIRAARQSVGLYPRPGTEFVKNPVRVALLAILPLYLLWWLWTVFALSQRERFTHGKSFPWILVPVYNYILIYNILCDLRDGERAYTGRSLLGAGRVILLLVAAYVFSTIGSNAQNLFVSLAASLIGLGAVVAAAFQAQSAMNRYLLARHPEAHRRRMSGGEWVAVGVTVATLLLIFVAIFSAGA